MGKLLACIKDAISFNLPPFLRFLCFGPDYGSIWESASVNVAGGWPLGVGSLATQSPGMCHQCYSPGESQLAPAPLLSFSLFLSVSLRFSPSSGGALENRAIKEFWSQIREPQELVPVLRIGAKRQDSSRMLRHSNVESLLTKHS